jgi:hypothetical protein
VSVHVAARMVPVSVHVAACVVPVSVHVAACVVPVLVVGYGKTIIVSWSLPLKHTITYTPPGTHLECHTLPEKLLDTLGRGEWLASTHLPCTHLPCTHPPFKPSSVQRRGHMPILRTVWKSVQLS